MKSIANTKNLTHEEWLALRRQGVGGSDAAAILGLNPFASPFSVYMDKVGLAPEKDESEAMWLGNQLEDAIAKRFETETGMKVQKRNSILQHPEHIWMLANVDRWVVGKKAGLEIKTTNMLNRTHFDSGDVPSYFHAQCLHYMAVTGADEWYLAVAVLGRSFHIFRIERNEAEIAALVAAEKRFWEENVMKQVPPPPDGSESDGNLMKALYPKEHGDNLLVPLFGAEEKLDRIQTLDEQIKSLEREEESLKQAIQKEIGDADGGKAQGYTVWWRSQSRTSLDSKKLQKEQPDIFDRYARTSSFRKFEIKKEIREREAA